MLKARIHSFESLGTVDGPGVRFVIFFQGCQLACKYCHNRDLWDCSIGKEYTLRELCLEVMHHKDFFEHGGGVTATGGEPLLQSEFLGEFFEVCRHMKIHTALDTSGAVTLNDSVKRVLKFTDLVLLDIKHMDEHKALELTGVSNRHTLQFAEYLSEKNIPAWIRYVVIPGYTDGRNDVIKFAEFISKMDNVQKVELLAYHSMGEHKWGLMGDEYELIGVDPPNEEDIVQLKETIRSYCPGICF